MLAISQIKLDISESEESLKDKVSKLLGLKRFSVNNNDFELIISKKSLDARDKTNIKFIYSVNIILLCKQADKIEKEILKKVNNKNVMLTNKKEYIPFSEEEIKLIENSEKNAQIYVIGSGPAGLFTALMLAKYGLKPTVVEKGSTADKRKESVEKFWQDEKELDEYSNVQFGEGGAGTFSDGKLNTGIKDKLGRIGFVLDTFVHHGASAEIKYDYKPHIGTDVLIDVVTGIREEIISLGGRYLFDTEFISFETDSCGRVCEIELKNVKTGEISKHECDNLVLATGHSSRDTFNMLYNKGLKMESKDFAMGVRIIHNQEDINKCLYGEYYNKLSAAPYKVTYNSPNNRGVYSFCMCPGGYVVNASSEKGGCCVNGMSYSGRDSSSANSAIIVQVKKEDFDPEDTGNPLLGMMLQKELEEKAYKLSEGRIPVQKYGDFKKNQVTFSYGNVKPCIKGNTEFNNLRSIFPKYISESIIEGVESFSRQISCFNDDDAVLCGPESRTSSPVRIFRDERFMSNVIGIYPAGEGSGYAGGITSAAVDGLKTFEMIVRNLFLS